MFSLKKESLKLRLMSLVSNTSPFLMVYIESLCVILALVPTTLISQIPVVFLFLKTIGPTLSVSLLLNLSTSLTLPMV